MTPAAVRSKVAKLVADAIEKGVDPEALYETLTDLANEWSDELERIDDALLNPKTKEPKDPVQMLPPVSGTPPELLPFWEQWE